MTFQGVGDDSKLARQVVSLRTYATSVPPAPKCQVDGVGVPCPNPSGGGAGSGIDVVVKPYPWMAWLIVFAAFVVAILGFGTWWRWSDAAEKKAEMIAEARK